MFNGLQVDLMQETEDSPCGDPTLQELTWAAQAGLWPFSECGYLFRSGEKIEVGV